MALFIVFPKLSVAAMAIYPFILIKKAEYKHNEVLVNHEKIHHRQQLELLIFPFYVLYLFNYLFNLIKYKSHYKAYLNIVFEREAFAKEQDIAYLKHRRIFAWYNWTKN